MSDRMLQKAADLRQGFDGRRAGQRRSRSLSRSRIAVCSGVATF